MKWDPRKLDSEWPFDVLSTDFELHAESTALIVVDMQGHTMTIDPNSALALEHPRLLSYWNRRLGDIVVPNILRLIGLFRGHTLKIVYTRNGNMTPTCDEMTDRLKAKLNRGTLQTDRNSPGYQINAVLAPRPDDLIVDKLTSGAFTATLLDHALRNMGIRSVVITGLLTDACVFGTARAAAELGYNTLLCEDACGTYTQRAHDEALLMHARIFGRVDTTDAVMSELALHASEPTDSAEERNEL